MKEGTEEDRVRHVEAVVSTVLRIGVVGSVVVMLLGLFVSFLRHPAYRTSSSVRKSVIDGHTHFPHSVNAVFTGAADGHGMAIVAVGLLILLLTPIARVAVTVGIFSIQRDRAFMAITGFVLVVLCSSFLIGGVAG